MYEPGFSAACKGTTPRHTKQWKVDISSCLQSEKTPDPLVSSEIKKSSWTDPAKQDEALKQSGGVQPYVIWIGVAFYILFAISMFKMAQDGPPDGEQSPGKPAKQVSASSV